MALTAIALHLGLGYFERRAQRAGAVRARRGSRRGTLPSCRPVLRRDRLYSRGSARVVGYNVVTSAPARVASDHLPVVAEHEATPRP